MLKSFGVLQMIYGMEKLPHLVSLALMSEGFKGFILSIRIGLPVPGTLIIAGWFLVFTTDWFVRLAYRKSAATDEGEIESDTLSGSSPE